MVNMTTNLAKNYFSKLLNSTIDENTVIKLSSGQSARAHTWLKSNNFNVDNLSLGNGFTIEQLIGGGASKVIDKNYGKTNKNQATNLRQYVPLNGSIGVDIQNIKELFPAGIPLDPKSDAELLGIFTIKELSYSQSRAHPLQTLTGLFAAKEAIQKCSEDKLNLTDIEILPDANGRPHTSGYSISISHSQDYAVAIATNGDKKNMDKNDVTLTNNVIPIGITSNAIQPVNKKTFRSLIIPFLVAFLVILEILRFLKYVS